MGRGTMRRMRELGGLKEEEERRERVGNLGTEGRRDETRLEF